MYYVIEIGSKVKLVHASELHHFSLAAEVIYSNRNFSKANMVYHQERKRNR